MVVDTLRDLRENIKNFSARKKPGRSSHWWTLLSRLIKYLHSSLRCPGCLGTDTELWEIEAGDEQLHYAALITNENLSSADLYLENAPVGHVHIHLSNLRYRVTCPRDYLRTLMHKAIWQATTIVGGAEGMGIDITEISLSIIIPPKM